MLSLSHITADFEGVAPELLDDGDGMLLMLTESVREAGLTPVASCMHKFSPMGVSGVVILAESHISIHTWPEQGFAAVDLLSCGSRSAALDAIEYLRQRLMPSSVRVETLPRGADSAVYAAK
jgi:S-adenosylmethionine decarboxylase proenzyme